MKAATLSRLTIAFAIVGIASYVLVYGGFVDGESEYIAKHVLMVSFGAVPVLLWLKAVSSSFFLQGLCGSSLLNLETLFMIFYPVLTKEARVAWKDKIEAKRLLDQNNSNSR